MSLHKSLVIELHGYWHAGSGRSAGALADALVHKDAAGLPLLGGRHLKGLLRHALAKTASLGWHEGLLLPAGPAADLETLLFGSVSQQEARYDTIPGMLIVSDGRLPAAEAAWLAAAEQAPARGHLYTQLSATAINDKGSARHDTLRTIEVTVPLSLHARLELALTASDEGHRQQQQAWLEQDQPWQALIEASSLIDSVGANRSRGLGEARFHWQDSQGLGAEGGQS